MAMPTFHHPSQAPASDVRDSAVGHAGAGPASAAHSLLLDLGRDTLVGPVGDVAFGDFQQAALEVPILIIVRGTEFSTLRTTSGQR